MTPAPRQIWKEVDPRIERYVRIEGIDPSGAHIRSVWKLGGEWVPSRGSRMTIANLDRFAGKRGGYAYVETPQ
jgi:hypothetical protein